MQELRTHSSHNSPREPDCSLGAIARAGVNVARFILRELEQEAYEEKMRESRYVEYVFRPVSREERQKIILAHEWVASVKDTCSRILGVDNRHQ